MWMKYPKIFRDTNRVFKNNVVIEEKLDGANVGIHWKGHQYKLQSRRNWTDINDHPQYRHFEAWAEANHDKFKGLPHCIIYGEYMFANHTVFYDKLPDWFICFDVWMNHRFIDFDEKVKFCNKFGFYRVPLLFRGKTTLELAKKLITKSNFGSNQMEGFVVKAYDKDMTMLKFTTDDFKKDLEESVHWMKKPICPNKLSHLENDKVWKK